MNVKLNIKEPPFIVFCLPGNTFSGEFLDSWTDLLTYCSEKRISYVVSRQYSAVVYYSRNLCLGGDIRRGENQKPFNGKFNYTHIMWIDSDMVFNRAHFQALLDHDKDVISAMYLMKDGRYFATVKDWDEEYFLENGTFQFLTEFHLRDHKGLMEVAYTGFGFILIKRHVHESLKYPWFRPLWHKVGQCKDFSSEDTAICKLIKKAGYKIYVDPQIRVGHLKEVIL